MAALSRILKAATRQPGDPLDIVVLGCTHERYESMLSRVHARFWVLNAKGLKGWDGRNAPPPANYTFLREGASLPPDVVPDLVLSQTRGQQFELGLSLSRVWRIPHVNLAHTLPPRGAGRAPRGDVNVFITEHSRDAWGFRDDPTAQVIEHGIDTEVFAPTPEGFRSPRVLAVANLFRERDAELGYYFFEEATRDIPKLVVGDNPGLSAPAHDLRHLAFCYATSRIFANTASCSPIPMSMLEAMSSGCAVISRRNPTIESLGDSIILVDTPGEMHEQIIRLLGDPVAAGTLGRRARSAILERFGMTRFVADWDGLFRRVAG